MTPVTALAREFWPAAEKHANAANVRPAANDATQIAPINLVRPRSIEQIVFICSAIRNPAG
jgi:hypothetical protein